MKTLKFKCTLKSEVILNVKSATEGPSQTLDFIPGNIFLGIAAGMLYEGLPPEDSMSVFHSGKVRFGDAHPNAENCNIRSLRTPAAMFYPKLEKETGANLYIHHLTPNLDSKEMKELQLKQCRRGFYAFESSEGKPAVINKSFAIKSAYDREKRRSKDEAMYGYESLQKDLELFFSIEIDDEVSQFAEKIKEALKGEKRIGRSRTAQYGLVEIEEYDFEECQSNASTNKKTIVYADSRLIFLDKNGRPTFQPSAKQLGLDVNAKIIWEESQIRTFQYAPWNFTRQCRDTDRCGIEKGSVIVVETTESLNVSRYVGSYINEGFGKIIYNPDFLKADGKGKSIVRLLAKDSPKTRDLSRVNENGSELLKYINKQIDNHNITKEIYGIVNRFVEDNEKRFTDKKFASQWGTIRNIVMQNKSKDELITKLYGKNKEEEKKAYLTHGVAADKWNDNKRLEKFKSFVEELTDENAQIAIINLAAEMAKKCKEGERR